MKGPGSKARKVAAGKLLSRENSCRRLVLKYASNSSADLHGRHWRIENGEELSYTINCVVHSDYLIRVQETIRLDEYGEPYRASYSYACADAKDNKKLLFRYERDPNEDRKKRFVHEEFHLHLFRNTPRYPTGGSVDLETFLGFAEACAKDALA